MLVATGHVMITIRAVQAMKPGDMLWDEKLPGFGARRQRDAVSYVLKYRVQGVQRYVTLGRNGPLTPDEARKKAKRMLGELASGNDPVTPKSDTVASAIDGYLTYAAKTLRRSTHADNVYYLRQVWRSLHRLPVVGVKRRDVAVGLTEIEANHSPVVAARARAALSAFFAWAIREGFEIPANPVSGTNRPVEPSARDRVLGPAELKAVWNACNSDDAGRIVRLLILLGQRRDEISKLQWSEVQGDRLILPGGRTKNGREHTVPLPPQALALLPEPCGDYVFGRGRGFTSWSLAKSQLDLRSGVSDWTLHDIRRSMATGMAELGILPHIIEAILNHASGHRAGVAGIYNRARYEAEMRQALNIWAAILRG
jgi:integrase